MGADAGHLLNGQGGSDVGALSRRQADAITYALRTAALPIALIAVVNSVLLIFAHARENKHPALRVYTVRILLMVVIDSISALCALWGMGWHEELDPFLENLFHFIVELYESVVIFSFLQFVLVCGGGPARLASKFASPEQPPQEEEPAEASSSPAAVMDGDGAAAAAACRAPADDGDEEGAAPAPRLRELQHVPGLGRLLPAWRSGKQMLRWCVCGTLSYVVVGGGLAIFGIFLLLCPGWEQHKSLVWKISGMLLSATQAIAIASLAELAVNVKEEISLLRPYGKFLSVKFVVFFAFWQGLLLQGLRKLGAFSDFQVGCGETCAVAVVQNALICVEMLAASIIHFYVFPPHDYLRLLAQNMWRYGEQSPSVLGRPASLTEVVDIRDIFRTAWTTLQVPKHRGEDARRSECGPAAATADGARPSSALEEGAAGGAAGAELVASPRLLGASAQRPFKRGRKEGGGATGEGPPAGGRGGEGDRGLGATDSASGGITDSGLEASPNSISISFADDDSGFRV